MPTGKRVNQSHYCANFDAFRYYGSDKTFLLCQTTSRDHMIKVICGLVSEISSPSRHPTKFGAYRSCRSGDETFLK